MKVNRTISIDVELAKLASKKINNLSRFVENKLIEELGLHKFREADSKN